MTYDLGAIVLTIMASVGGLAGLLVVMTLLEPTKVSVRRQRQQSIPARAGIAEQRGRVSR